MTVFYFTTRPLPAMPYTTSVDVADARGFPLIPKRVTSTGNRNIAPDGLDTPMSGPALHVPGHHLDHPQPGTGRDNDLSRPVGLRAIMSDGLSLSAFSWRVMRVNGSGLVEHVWRDDAAGRVGPDH